MTVHTTLVSVTTSVTALNTLSTIAGSSAAVYNDGAVTVYVGGADVATSGATKGVPLDPTASVDVDGEDDILYGIVATGTCNVIVLEAGVA